ncbi:GGDEF domain-containing protein [Pseudidiomarina mangrovi]|uniref:GGDEF domain-containing protein n=1 Tax=Pseudidiomarina mangrovi TaxID=2487133 RepID=UPI0013E042B7|nr:GGDEF domain-containing protein [Pseudidiomarina mangrovi]CAI8152703.1 MAG: putative diguanylate cyclase AdrA [Pseudidiomarina mangrovi]
MAWQAIVPIIIASVLVFAALFIYLIRLQNFNQQIQQANKRLALAEHELREKNVLLHQVSVTDKLTGVYNRHHLDTVLAEEFEHARRYHRPLSLVLFDLDRFKRINDQHGHQVGDYVLTQFARLGRDNVRRSDTFGRWGGEEFLLICPELTAPQAAEVANKIRQLLADRQWQLGFTQTVSAGVCERGDLQSVDHFISAVDRQLYRAKASGRNTVCSDSNQPVPH